MTIKTIELVSEIEDLLHSTPFDAFLVAARVIAAYGDEDDPDLDDIGAEIWDYVAAAADITPIDAAATVLAARSWGVTDEESVSRMTIAMETLNIDIDAAHKAITD